MKNRKKKNRYKMKKSVLVPIWLLGISVLLLLAGIYIEGFADWYVSHIYSVLTGIIGRIFGLVPTSAAEIGLYILVIVLVFGFIYIVLSIIHGAWNRYRTGKTIRVLFCVTAVLFFLYVINCGINYHTTSFANRSGIQPREYTKEELEQTCMLLTEDVIKTESKVQRDENRELVFDKDIGKNAVRAMQNLGETYKELKGYYPQPKRLLLPEFLSYQSLTGIYSPFTVEANYNSDMEEYNIPFTMCHELSHLKGFMQEQEANFIAWLACSTSEMPQFQYSAALSGWLYATNLLWEYDQNVYDRLYAMLPESAKKDLKENDTYWEKYDGKIAEVSNQINDAYLKTNGQKDGVKSYDKMVDMLVVYKLDKKQ